MKTRILCFLSLILVWLVCLPADAIGFSYEYFSNGTFTSVHVLTVDPKEHAIRAVRASGELIARETVKDLAIRHGAQAGINGGFWKINGDPAGILKIHHRWIGTPAKPRGAIGWSQDGRKVLIDRVLTNYSLQDCPNDCEIEVLPVSIPPHTTPEEWKETENIVGGTPVLVCGGNLVEDFSCEQTLQSFLADRHPRTAVGIRANGEWVFAVVDGRFYGFFGGMIMKDLARLMLDLGCVEALNLDGGGSSTLVIEGAVVNDPCGSMQEDGKQVEAVSDAILIFTIIGRRIF